MGSVALKTSIAAGDLRHVVQFQQLSANTNDLGEQLQVWANVGAPVWASITNMRLYPTDESVYSGQEKMRNIVMFTMRYQTVDPDWRLVCEDTIYDVKVVAGSNDRKVTTVIAKVD